MTDNERMVKMKIWCLKCGNIVAQSGECKTKVTLCPCCSERIAYSVANNEIYIACLNYDLKQNNELRIISA